MRILWHSAAPWEPTGYGTQTGTWTTWLASQGHDVAISAYHGLNGTVSEWFGGVPVFPAPLAGNGPALWPYYAREWKADLVIVLADFWTMEPAHFRDMPRTLVWLPMDTDPMSALDFWALKQTGAVPVAMSRHCRALLERAGWPDPAYVPHGIDTSLFRPLENRAELRLRFGFTDEFVAGMNFNNIDPVRKAAPQQMAAFARLARRHPERKPRLLIHTQTPLSGSLNIEMLAITLGIRDLVQVSDQHRMQQGTITQPEMAAWYNACDVVMNATMGEGFGLPGLEAQACGTPVILSANSTGPELAAPASWTVRCDPWWNHAHQSWWGMPLGSGLDKALEQASRPRTAAARALRSEAVRAHALAWDVAPVGALWSRVLEGP